MSLFYIIDISTFRFRKFAIAKFISYLKIAVEDMIFVVWIGDISIYSFTFVIITTKYLVPLRSLFETIQNFRYYLFHLI